MAKKGGGQGAKKKVAAKARTKKAAAPKAGKPKSLVAELGFVAVGEAVRNSVKWLEEKILKKTPKKRAPKRAAKKKK